jgi:dTDP-4-dehydrorhamnose 3,5-epimerase-like enzyme
LNNKTSIPCISSMQVTKTEIPGVLIITPRRIGDARGFFSETFQAERYASAGVPYPFVQDNWSRSRRGCAHGFVVLSETADFLYKCDQYYSPQDEIVVRWNDPALGIDWRISDPVLGPRDAAAPLLADVPRLPSFDA